VAKTCSLKTAALQVAIRKVEIETVNTTEPQSLKIALTGLQGRTQILAASLLLCHQRKAARASRCFRRKATNSFSAWAISLVSSGWLGLFIVTTSGRWLIRTIAAVFDPQQQQRASGSHLV
jgi:hypothetical protein